METMGVDNKNTVYMSIGAPGSGKSTWWLLGQKEGIIPHENVIRINMDDIREQITGDAGDQSQNNLVYKIAMSNLKSALSQQIPVIYWDATSVKRRDRRKMTKLIKQANYDVIGIWFDLPKETLKERNANRDRQVDESVIDRMWKQLNDNPPSLEEGFDQIIIINE